MNPRVGSVRSGDSRPLGLPIITPNNHYTVVVSVLGGRNAFY